MWGPRSSKGRRAPCMRRLRLDGGRKVIRLQLPLRESSRAEPFAPAPLALELMHQRGPKVARGHGARRGELGGDSSDAALRIRSRSQKRYSKSTATSVLRIDDWFHTLATTRERPDCVSGIRNRISGSHREGDSDRSSPIRLAVRLQYLPEPAASQTPVTRGYIDPPCASGVGLQPVSETAFGGSVHWLRA